jgi:iron complex outermembrane receptor protein
VNVATGSRSFQSHTRVNFSSAMNDFPYTNDTGAVVNQQNASFMRYGVSQELYGKIKDKHLLTGRLWYLSDDRNLPPTTTNYDSGKKETLYEKALRSTLDYKFVASGYTISVRSALNDQYMHYQNKLLDLSSEHKSLTWTSKTRLVFSRVKKIVLKPGLDYTFDRVISDDYDGTKYRNTFGLYLETIYSPSKKITSSLVLREEIIDGKWMPFIPAFGLEYKPFTRINLAFSANLSRNVHSPTLNDLYWKDYGNPSLKPEINYAAEAGITWNWADKKHQYYLETTVSGYYSRIFDMITWTPVDSSSLYRPENIDEILARGVEVGLNGTLTLLQFTISLKTNYTFTRSTYEKASSAYDDKIGNQQIYIPVNTFNATASIERWKFYLSYNFNYTGDRFTGKENLSIMPAYTLSNLIFGKNFGLKKIVLSLQLDINNLFNLDYQSIASRPMPGINYGFTFKVAYRKNRLDEYQN